MLKSLGLIHDVLLLVIEGLVLLVAPFKVAEVDPLGRVRRGQHHAGAGAGPDGVRGGSRGHQRGVRRGRLRL